MKDAGRWVALMKRQERDIPLDEAALLISAQANPAVDITGQLRRLDSLAADVGAADTSKLCEVLFEGLRLRGDRETYNDPVNSYIDQVLDRRKGIPISLSVLMIEIGRRCGLRLEGVGMPGHFLVRDPGSPHLLIDPFDSGRRLDHNDCERIFRVVTGSQFGLTPELLATTGTRAILSRMLANLDRSFERQGDYRSLLWVCRLRLAIPTLPLADRMQLAGRLTSLGQFGEAADVLDEWADQQRGNDAVRLKMQARGIRSRLN